MADKVLIDTNILLDYLLEREPYFKNAKEVIISCVENKGNRAKRIFEIARHNVEQTKANISILQKCVLSETAAPPHHNIHLP